MSNANTTLPRGFKSLEPFVEQWAISGTAERARARRESAPEEREAFFEAARDLVDPALALLDQKPLDQLDEREQRLMDLMLSVAHIALAVELHAEEEHKVARASEHMIITKSVADE